MNQNKQRALALGRLACDTMMKHYTVNQLPPQRLYHRATFNYQQGVLLLGMAQIYRLTRDRRYLDYISEWAQAVQDEDGRIREPSEWISSASLDFRQGGNVLAFLYEETGDAHLLELLTDLVDSLAHYPVNRYGGFWHMASTPDQMWLDGLYMAGPLLTRYAVLTGKADCRELALRQALLMHEHMRDPATGLLRHGWDPEKRAGWADAQTGLSSEVWGRACGWYTAALADMLEDTPAEHPQRDAIIHIQQALIGALLRYQSAEGRWYQVVDKWQQPGNWPENSCTSLFVYAILKGVRQGYIAPEARTAALRAYRRILATLPDAPENEIAVGSICVGTCIDEGSYAHYIHRDRAVNGMHGMGPFILMTSEVAKYEADAGNSRT